ncbi:O-methyltransferase family 3 [Rhodomicrobium vannielii ATCC 17100]|uniref:O-methyltransferase family 3 n=1 Tax=Rhodomicrobium vannielii (strain ATCC 17100 / DSM 162 / LMG 4299 / NCIMB 10020 / ATH 3.1.1) TaxID=648757 RepID=E3I7U1_RHOVT|nr:O-methyltransferase [Rhodomicrobium vannielii]ADP70795.1 O-methyltransferase family 3 [Rhodomicrobium vannielii ATCC 17100]
MTDIFSAVDGYIEGLFAKEDDALAAAVADMEAAAMPGISVSPVLGRLLFVLAKAVRARRILEIGTLGGYSAIWLGRALPEDGRMISLEVDPRHGTVARKNLARAGLSEKVEVHEGAALDILPRLIASDEPPFDFIFIDADKEPYLDYFELSLRLSKPGTMIVADNVIRHGAVIDPARAENPAVAGVKRLSDALAAHPAVDATIIQTVGVKSHDGLALAVVREGR